MKILIPIFLTFLITTVAFGSEVYTWEDDNGGLHFTDDPSTAPAKKQKRNLDPVVTMGSTTGINARERILGVFSNGGDGFSKAQLIVREDGKALFEGGVVGIVCDWSYDIEPSTLALNCYDYERDRDFSINFKFDQEHRYYIPIDVDKVENEGHSKRFQFITDEISENVARIFKEYPEKISEARKRNAETKRRYEERLRRSKY